MDHVKTVAPQRWWYLMPIIFITYSLAYLDRANYGFAAAAGIDRDLGITHATSSLIGSLFFLGYCLFQIPGAIYAQKNSVKKLIFASLLLWGACAALTGMVSNIPMLMALRFILGIVEAAVMPSMLMYISRWFTRTERSRANTFLILGNPVTVLWMSVLSGYLVKSFGWREMFIIEGVPAIAWAIVWWFTVKDKPADAPWMTDAEKAELDARLKAEQAHIAPVRDYKAAFRSSIVLKCCAIHALWSVGVYGFIMWLPSILKSASAIDIVSVGWLSAVPYLAAIVLMLLASWLSDKTRNRKLFVWPLLLIGTIAFVGSYLVGSSNFWLSFTLLVIAGATMYAPYGPFFALVPELIPSNVLGGAIGFINASGALGAFLGSWVVGYLNGATGSPAASYAFMAAALFASVVLMMLVPAHSGERSTPSGSAGKKPVPSALAK
ncbi:MFS transporter (plasmid) [Burkholderia sp. SFA1]|uniref:MFS transporter n=1 Tax=unclassified Caballeronia TaxID=2646786 RepID=UPI001F28FBC3|nr:MULTISPECIES: MFS transporter [unclassified Caballeronia]MCE4545852.1 MFS transporter [Caballeronia sp. PC1]MCE4572026.1 MFS transporter [Caballeronia sp. CLC5]BBQ01206.1 MFS transporter [Burkholderia sp. SFA1]